jgi:hypothetical protein
MGSLILVRPFEIQLLGHAEPGMAGWLTLDPTEHSIPAPFIKARCLKGDRVEHRCRASALSRFGFGLFNYLSSDPVASQCLRQEE